jgi:hypothetical protein
MIVAGGTSLPTGVVGVVQNNHNVYGIAIQRLFGQIRIPIEFATDATLPPNVVAMIVYQKPIQ